MRPSAEALLPALAFALPAVAQQQVVKPPIAVYWMSVDTTSGMGAGMNVMSMMMGGGSGGAARTMRLELGSSQKRVGEPRAATAFRPDSPWARRCRWSRRSAHPRTRRATHESIESPKGRMLIYWGCGENMRAGHRSSSISPGSRRPASAEQVSRQVRGPRPGVAATAPTATGPMPRTPRPVPANASLRGDHVVKGNYSPEIKFAVGESHDFMEPVSFSPLAKASAGAMPVKWKQSPTPPVISRRRWARSRAPDGIMWSSSEVQEMGRR